MGGMTGGMNPFQMEMQKEMMEHHQEMMENHHEMHGDNFENMYDNMNNMEFEEPEFEMEDGMGYGMGTMGMGAMGMGGVANMGMSGAMGMGSGMGVAQTVVPVTGVRYKLKPYTYKYSYPVWKPDTKMAFTQTPYNNPCAGGCSSETHTAATRKSLMFP